MMLSMNRRNFMTKLAGIGAFMILPGARRIWKATVDTRLLTFQEVYHALDVVQVDLYDTLPFYLAQEVVKEERELIKRNWQLWAEMFHGHQT